MLGVATRVLGPVINRGAKSAREAMRPPSKRRAAVWFSLAGFLSATGRARVLTRPGACAASCRMARDYALTPDEEKAWGAVVLLHELGARQRAISVAPDRAWGPVVPTLDWMFYDRQYIDVDGTRYVPTDRGREVLERFRARYTEFLQAYEVFSAVDLEAGVFAWASANEYADDAAWRAFVDQPRFEDLRVAVVAFKGLDPREAVFMAALHAGEFDLDAMERAGRIDFAPIFRNIETICASALHAEDLSYEDEEGIVPGEEVLEDIIAQGAALNLERSQGSAEGAESAEDDWADVHYEEISYDAYADPYYVGAPWRRPWLL